MTEDEITDIRETWQPAPGSRLAEALDTYGAALAAYQATAARVAVLQEERHGVQTRLDAVALGSDPAAVAGDINAAAALDLVIMRGQLAANRQKTALRTAESQAAGVVEQLRLADKRVMQEAARWGRTSDNARTAEQARAAEHARYLATPTAALEW